MKDYKGIRRYWSNMQNMHYAFIDGLATGVFGMAFIIGICTNSPFLFLFGLFGIIVYGGLYIYANKSCKS